MHLTHNYGACISQNAQIHYLFHLLITVHLYVINFTAASTPDTFSRYVKEKRVFYEHRLCKLCILLVKAKKNENVQRNQ